MCSIYPAEGARHLLFLVFFSKTLNTDAETFDSNKKPLVFTEFLINNTSSYTLLALIS